MRYFRVKKEYDNIHTQQDHILIQNELYTEEELKKYNVQQKHVVPVELNEEDTYWCFGARFSDDCGFYD